MESLNSMQLVSVATAALISSLLNPNKRTPNSAQNPEEGEEEKDVEEEILEEESEHIQFLKQVFFHDSVIRLSVCFSFCLFIPLSVS